MDKVLKKATKMIWMASLREKLETSGFLEYVYSMCVGGNNAVLHVPTEVYVLHKVIGI